MGQGLPPERRLQVHRNNVFAALARGADLARAAGFALAAEPGFDRAATLAVHPRLGTFMDCDTGDASPESSIWQTPAWQSTPPNDPA